MTGDLSSSTTTPTNIQAGDDLLGSIMGAIKGIGPAIQTASNQYAMLQAQNEDIAAARWTPNNLVAQWNTMTPQGQAGMAVIVSALVYFLVKKS